MHPAHSCNNRSTIYTSLRPTFLHTQRNFPTKRWVDLRFSLAPSPPVLCWRWVVSCWDSCPLWFGRPYPMKASACTTPTFLSVGGKGFTQGLANSRPCLVGDHFHPFSNCSDILPENEPSSYLRLRKHDQRARLLAANAELAAILPTSNLQE